MPQFPTIDEDGLPTKGMGGQPGGFTGGGGGGPGGGSFGFGGGGLGVPFAPAGMRGGFGLFQQADRKRQRAGMPSVPGVTPGAPQPSDTVPAMLTPGEIVMNNGVTSDPQLAQALTHLNMMGAQRMMQPQGFAYGGRACGYGYGGEVAQDGGIPAQLAQMYGLTPDALAALVMAKANGGGHGVQLASGYAYGGHVNPFLMALRYMNMPAGYAFGGGVFGKAQQAMGGMMGNRAAGMMPGRSTAAPAASGPSGGIPNTAPGYFTNNGSWSMVDPTSADQRKAGVWSDNSGNVRNREGNLLSFDPRNPYAVMSQSYDPTARGVGMRQLGAFGEAGYWDPNGNQALMNSVRGEALANARAAQQGAGLRAQLAGMDPGAAASYRMEAGLRGSSDVARALNNARTQSMLQQQAYANNLAGNLISNQNQQFTMENQTRNQDLLNSNQHSRETQGGGLAQLGGQLLGTGLGAFTGGIGSGAAKSLFGGK